MSKKEKVYITKDEIDYNLIWVWLKCKKSNFSPQKLKLSVLNPDHGALRYNLLRKPLRVIEVSNH